MTMVSQLVGVAGGGPCALRLAAASRREGAASPGAGCPPAAAAAAPGLQRGHRRRLRRWPPVP